MQNIDRHIMAITSRKSVEMVWIPSLFKTKKMQLYARCFGVVVADRVENAVFHNDWRHVNRRGLGE